MAELPASVPVDQVVDGLYIGGWRSTLHADELRAAGITHVLKLYQFIPHFPADFSICENPVEDGEPLPLAVLRRGVDFVLGCLDSGQPVLVMCGAGISRSAVFVLAVLVERRTDLREAFRLLRERHMEATPHPQLWASLIEHYGLAYTVDDAMDWMRHFSRPG